MTGLMMIGAVLDTCRAYGVSRTVCERIVALEETVYPALKEKSEKKDG